MMLQTLKKRREFVEISKSGVQSVAKGLILQLKKSDIAVESDVINVGFTVSKKVGNAVKRNRAKRRLRSLAREIMSEYADKSFKYVLIGRKETLDRDFDSLRKDLKFTLHDSGSYHK